MKGDLVSIEETEDTLQIWHHGLLIYNIHGAGLEAMIQVTHRADLLTFILQTDPTLIEDFVKQLRLYGLFKPDKEKPLV